jgi:hypothetical protein
MMQGFGTGLVRAALALLVAVVLSAAGWGHRLPGPAGGDGAGLAVYLAAGGSVADLCGTPDGTAVPDGDCPVCQMPAALPLPGRVAPATALAVTVVVAEVAGDAPRGTGRHPPWYGRAPPLV